MPKLGPSLPVGVLIPGHSPGPDLPTARGSGCQTMLRPPSIEMIWPVM